MEGGIALLYGGKLSVDIPAIGVDCPRVTRVAAVCGCTCPIQPPVESNPDTIKVNRSRFIPGAQWERAAGFSQTIIEIFQSGAPARRDGKFGTCAQSPTRTHSQNLVLVTCRVGVLEEPRLRPSKPPRRVEKPVAKSVARTATHRRDEVELFGDGAG